MSADGSSNMANAKSRERLIAVSRWLSATMNSRRPVNSNVRVRFELMNSLVAFVLSSLLLLAVFATTDASGERTTQKFRSGISGRVTDRNGAVVVRARITIVARSSNRSVNRTTNDEGQYVADLEPDTYDVVAAAEGFKTANRNSIPVLRDSRSYVDFVLYESQGVTPAR